MKVTKDDFFNLVEKMQQDNPETDSKKIIDFLYNKKGIRIEEAIQEKENEVGIGGKIINTFKGAVRGAVQPLRHGIESVGEGVKNIAGSFGEDILTTGRNDEGSYVRKIELPEGENRDFMNRVQEFGRGLTKIGTGGLEAIIGLTPMGAGAGAIIGGASENIPDSVKDTLKNLVESDTFKSAVEAWNEYAPGNIKENLQDPLFREGALAVAEISPFGSKKVQNLVKKELDVTKDIGLKAVDKAKEMVKKAPGIALESTKSVLSLPKNIAVSTYNKVKNEVKEINNLFKEPSKVLELKRGEVYEYTKDIFDKAEKLLKDKSTIEELKKVAEKNIKKELGKQEIIKKSLDFSYTGISDSNQKVHKYVFNNIINGRSDGMISLSDIAREVKTLFSKMSTGQAGYNEAKQIRNLLLEKTTPKYQELTKEISELYRIRDIVKTKDPLKTLETRRTLPESIQDELNDILKSKDNIREEYLNNVLDRIKNVGAKMDEEIQNSVDQFINIADVRNDYINLFKEQGIDIIEEVSKKGTGLDIDDIIKNNPDNPIVLERNAYNKALDIINSSEDIIKLRKEILNSSGKINMDKVKELLSQEHKTSAGDKLKSILPQKLQNQILKDKALARTVLKYLIQGSVVGGALKTLYD